MSCPTRVVQVGSQPWPQLRSRREFPDAGQPAAQGRPGRQGRPCAATDRAGEENTLVSLVRAAAAGDEQAWAVLHGRFDRRLRAVGSQFNLGPEDAGDAAQNTWCELLRSIDRIRRPESVSAWLMSTMRRECLRTAIARRREQLVDDWSGSPVADAAPSVEDRVLTADGECTLRGLVARLPSRQRQILHTLGVAHDGSYRHVAELLGIAVGTVGPTRARALARLRALMDEAGLGLQDFVLGD